MRGDRLHKNAKEFERWLRKQGIEIDRTRGKGGHVKLTNPANGKVSTMTSGKRDLPKGLVEGIKKQLGLK